MIYRYQDIQHVHLEISSECNAQCPLCPRNYHGHPLNLGYQEHSMTLAEAQKIFSPIFLQQIRHILINGNFGDIVMCPEAPDIIDYLRARNADAMITVSTNGAARNPEFWHRLAQAGCHVIFCIDGLADTHSIYRRNTSYSTVIKNAETFMQAGGVASWKFIVFDHNQHQLEDAKTLSEQMGFRDFIEVRGSRHSGPVYDGDRQLVYFIGKRDHKNYEFDHMLYHDQRPISWSSLPLPRGSIECHVQKTKSIYINSIGEVYPCCWIGFNPTTFNKLQPWSLVNPQIAEIMWENNALEYGIEHAMAWFNQVSDSWKKPDFESGLLQRCAHTCSGPKPGMWQD